MALILVNRNGNVLLNKVYKNEKEEKISKRDTLSPHAKSAAVGKAVKKNMREFIDDLDKIF